MPFNLPLLPSSLRPRIIAVDCGARHVVWGRFTRGAGGRVLLEHWAMETHGTDANPETDWTGRTARALAALTAREKPAGSCRLALAGHHTLVKFARVASPGRNDRRDMIGFEAEQSIPLPLEQVVWDHLAVVDNGSEMKFMLAAVKRELAGTVTNAAHAAGFRLAQMVPAGLALLHAFRYNYAGDCHGALAVEVGARSTHLVFVEREGFFIRTFALGGDTVTQAVADELRIDFMAAEALKTAVLSGISGAAVEVAQHDAVRRACARFAERLHLEIVRSTIRYRCHSGGAQPATVYLCGGGALIPELPVLLADKLAARVVRLEPLRNVEVAAGAHPGSAVIASRLAGLVGLGASLVDKAWPGLNLLPAEVIKAHAARRRQPALLGAALLAAAAPLPVAWAERHASRTAETASRALEQRLVPLRAIAARKARDLARIEDVRRRIEATRRIFESKAGWVAFFNDLQARLAKVEDVWLEKLQVVHPSDQAVRGPARAFPSAVRFLVSGRLLDRDESGLRAGPGAYGRARSLLQQLRQSPFVTAVENERFAGPGQGVARFDLTLVMNPNRAF